MIVPVLAAVIAVLVVVAGGDLTRMAAVRLRLPVVAVAALLAQVVVVYGLLDRPAVATAVMAVSYALSAWVVWLNRQVPGLYLVAVGGGANLAAIAANDGIMPATAGALASAGIEPAAGFTNTALAEGAPLWFLGDVFAVPAGWPLANVFSVGDVVLLVGLAIFLRSVCGAPAASGEDCAQATMSSGSSPSATHQSR